LARSVSEIFEGELPSFKFSEAPQGHLHSFKSGLKLK